MSKLEFKLPDIGEGVTEGEIVSWLVAQGDSVAEDQDMVEVMTDKATVTIGAPSAGTVAELRAQVGDTVPVGHVIVVLDAEGGGSSKGGGASAGAAPKDEGPQAAAKQEPKASNNGGGAATAVGDIKESLPGMSSEPARAPAQPASTVSAGDYYDEQPSAAPATRKLARELGVDLRRIPPSGDAGRVTREDVQRFATHGGSATSSGSGARAPAGSSTAAGAPAGGSLSPVPPATPVPQSTTEERIPIRGMRKRVFESMARSKRTAAHFTYVDECECSRLIELRSRVKAVADAEGVKLTFLPFIVKAVVASLKKYPALNTLVDDTSMEMVRRKTYDIGIAVATPSGLVVPVLRGADRLNILEIAREVERLAVEARDGKTRREDLGGSSFTITSLGKLGGLLATPVVNYPEVGILFIPEMKKRPVVKNDEIVVGHVMDLSLSFDHRIIDGYDGAQFTQYVIELLQDPDRLLLSM